MYGARAAVFVRQMVAVRQTGAAAGRKVEGPLAAELESLPVTLSALT